MLRETRIKDNFLLQYIISFLKIDIYNDILLHFDSMSTFLKMLFMGFHPEILVERKRAF
jgi:hypothetical protein